jgi:hypothetical protein
MAILELDSLQQLQQQQGVTTLQTSFKAWVCRAGCIAAAGSASPIDRAATLLQEASSAKELFQVRDVYPSAIHIRVHNTAGCTQKQHSRQFLQEKHELCTYLFANAACVELSEVAGFTFCA